MNICSTAEKIIFEDGAEGVGLKLQADLWEFNISFTYDDIPKLESVIGSAWKRGSIKAGISASSPVFWSCDGNRVSILIGRDDESWDVGFFISISEFADAINEVKNTLPPVRE